ncbi:MAG: ABC transporter ATP-binding protein/permease [Clostridia bacterium]|nr:ABC transporter ATP-binding protein/permease [Clostridia bacterium]
MGPGSEIRPPEGGFAPPKNAAGFPPPGSGSGNAPQPGFPPPPPADEGKKKRAPGGHSMLSNIFFMLKIIVKVSPLLIAGEALTYIIGVLPMRLIPVIGLKYIIDTFEYGGDVRKIAFAIVAIIAIMLVDRITNALFNNLFARREREKLSKGVSRTLFDKAAELDLASFDDPAFYGDFIIALQSSSDNINRLVRMIRDYIGNFLSLAAIGSVMIAIDPVCLIITLVFVLAFIPMGRYLGKLMMERRVVVTEKHRMGDYFARLFYLPDHAAELKMNGVSPLLIRRFDRAADDIYTTHKKYVGKIDALRMTQNFTVDVIGLLFVMCAYMGYRVMVSKTMTTGDFVAAFNGTAQISNSVFYLTVVAVRMFTEQSKLIEKYRTFLKAGVKITDGGRDADSEEPETIRFENVSFAYAGSSENALKDVSFEVRPGEHVALVGYNGAGKTTVTNLLLRLYDVDGGHITVGGEDIRDFNVKNHRGRFAAVFQDFKLFGATVGENVALSEHYDTDRVMDALRMAGFDKELPEGTQTVLLREFSDSGMMLSGGEQQKIAIARAFYKQCPYVILDEPSANLDPVAEYELNLAMSRAARGRTVMFISHRLSTTRHADRIIMMDSGRIIEEGSHDELMALGGKYAEMFSLQAEKYTD